MKTKIRIVIGESLAKPVFEKFCGALLGENKLRDHRQHWISMPYFYLGIKFTRDFCNIFFSSLDLVFDSC